MPNELPLPDELNNLIEKRAGKDRRQKAKPRFDDDDDADDDRRSKKKDRRGHAKSHRTLYDD
ncbi:MAG: hypothetical protein KDA91_24155 [Planctomycetaceae bacterium]|nr:hypothetical protein [Planctomycetaceae bacterium]